MSMLWRVQILIEVSSKINSRVDSNSQTHYSLTEPYISRASMVILITSLLQARPG
jgi:hypothetical protein